MKLVEKVVKIFLWICCWKRKNFKKTKTQKYTFPCLLVWEWAKQIFNLELSNLQQLMEPKVALPKPIPMNHLDYKFFFFFFFFLGKNNINSYKSFS
jgi:hypothetical protein